jgi:tetratricopeptide (TPR) repeat protein
MSIDSTKIPWISAIDQLPLSRTEQEVVRRFLQDPGGRGFLPVADVLRTHKLLEESLELLTLGVQRHPSFTVARVVLARELYLRGMLLQAWTLLEGSPVPLYDNVLAQKLIFKMAVAFGDERSALSSYTALRQLQGLDDEAKRLGEMLEANGIAITRDTWRKELRLKGIEVSTSPSEYDTRREGSSATDSKVAQGNRGARFILEYELDGSTREQFQNYHVLPLKEIFSGESGSGSLSSKTGSDAGAIELDSTTLAEIYTKQGHYSKALGIYRRLLRLSPHNDLLRLKVSELSRLDSDQRRTDFEADPAMYDKMEVVEIIDRQMRFYSNLLDRIK